MTWPGTARCGRPVNLDGGVAVALGGPGWSRCNPYALSAAPTP
ncbi:MULTISPECIES: hypothetical protein [Streptomyces]|nr:MULTISPECIES: hypothetical protein [Streptomyces]MCZ4098452.1 hypothetical protein [Streptomyces sp. H39-C1]